MRTLHKTITLTVLGVYPSLTDVVPGGGCADVVGSADGRTIEARRALLVIRPDDDASRLRRRLRDSITRLAGGAAADAGRLAGQIVDDLHRTPRADAAHRGWTMTHIADGPHSDPYAPSLSRLRLVDAPTRLKRVRRRLRRSPDRMHGYFSHSSTVLNPVCLS